MDCPICKGYGRLNDVICIGCNGLGVVPTVSTKVNAKKETKELESKNKKKNEGK